jgi:inner membrane protein
MAAKLINKCMDSLTHIVLGAATGEVVLGKKVGNKALLWGAFAGSIPDFDVAVTSFYEPVKSLFVHRGFSHSVVFALIIAPLLGLIISKIHKEASFRQWTWLSLWALLVHSGIDCFNTYGTALLEPISEARLAFDSLGIVDFVFLIPISIMMIIVVFRPQFTPLRKILSISTLVFTLIYLTFSIGNKLIVERKVKTQLIEQNIKYSRLKTSPLPVTNFLWLVLAEDSLGYHYGYISNFDKKPIELKYVERNHTELGKYANSPTVKNLIKFTKGFYAVEQKNDESLWLYDLRFGSMAFENEKDWYVFSFQIEGDAKTPNVSRAHPNRSFSKNTFKKYRERLFRDL